MTKINSNVPWWTATITGEDARRYGRNVPAPLREPIPEPRPSSRARWARTAVLAVLALAVLVPATAASLQPGAEPARAPEGDVQIGPVTVAPVAVPDAPAPSAAQAPARAPRALRKATPGPGKAIRSPAPCRLQELEQEGAPGRRTVKACG